MDAKILMVIVGMAAVTYFPRMLPLVVLSKIEIPPVVLRWLGFIPVAVLSSLLAPELLVTGQRFDVSLSNHYLLAALPCFLVAYKTKNLFYTVFTGMACLVILTRLWG